MSWTERLTLAERVARDAGELLRTKFGRHLQIRSKGVRSNLVTDADTESEALIRRAIAASFPGDAVLGEEEGLRGGGDARWIIDPLDGTTNFTHGYPLFAVSIAFESQGTVVLGVVCDPMRDELFVAVQGEAARCNGGALAVSKTADMRDALLVTGFPPFGGGEPPNLAPFEEFMVRSQALRRDGSAALDLCYVAAGRFDGFWEPDLHAWDIAAGALIVERAGGRVSDYRGGPAALDGRQIVASNGAIHDAMTDVLKNFAP
ncbi:MAG TPA: inositol monophosphatase family protein [Candidatus Eremiobacteraceae bacterium]|jgi:myo-inositol-1(or 4)-monophosphatase|nr:inositol monophosphatase family protein [Candidatus Eremiobacteraceae bacterium]